MASDIYDGFEPQMLQSALENISQHISEQEQRYFYSSASASQISKLVGKANLATGLSSWRKKRHAYGTEIQSFLAEMAEFSVVANFTLPSEEKIWGLTKLVVTIVLSSSEYLGKSIDLLRSLSVGGLENHEALMKAPTSEDVQKAFGSYYLVILDIIGEILWFLKEKETKNLKSRWKYLSTRFDTEGPRISRFKRYLAAEAQLSHEIYNAKERESISLYRQDLLQYYVYPVLSSWAGVLEAAKTDKELQPMVRKILSIRISNYDYESYYKRYETDTSSRTFDWLTGMEDFKSWSNLQSLKPTLWLYGSAGCGKSVLTARIIKMLSIVNPNRVSYHFCSRENPQSLQVETIMRSILAQLVNDTTSIHHVYPVFDLPLNLVAITDRINQFLGFRNFWGSKRSDMIIVNGIEALGKAAEAELTKILEKLCWGGHLKLLMVKQGAPPRHRKGINLDELLQPYLDVKLFVEEELDKNVATGRLLIDKNLLSTAKAAIIASASGNFLMARLLVGLVLHASNEESLLEILERLPNTIISTYNLALNSIKSEGDKVKAKKIFNIVGVAPEHLSTEALSDYLDWNSRSSDLPPYSPEALLDVCKGLVVCKEYDGNKYVHFVHPSFKEYLIKNKILYESRAHIEVAKVCIQYLHQEEFEHKISIQHDQGKSSEIFEKPAENCPSDSDEENGDEMLSNFSNMQIIFEDDIGILRKTISTARSQDAMVNQLSKTHPFLKYAKECWLYHSRTLDKGDPSWKGFQDLVTGQTKLLFDIHPWTRSLSGELRRIESAKEYRQVANDWANVMKHFAVSRVLVDTGIRRVRRRPL